RKPLHLMVGEYLFHSGGSRAERFRRPSLAWRRLRGGETACGNAGLTISTTGNTYLPFWIKAGSQASERLPRQNPSILFCHVFPVRLDKGNMPGVRLA